MEPPFFNGTNPQNLNSGTSISVEIAFADLFRLSDQDRMTILVKKDRMNPLPDPVECHDLSGQNSIARPFLSGSVFYRHKTVILQIVAVFHFAYPVGKADLIRGFIAQQLRNLRQAA